MIHTYGYIYIVQAPQHANQNIYKIGRTTQKLPDIRDIKRIKGYPYGTVIICVYIVNAHQVVDIEKEIIRRLALNYKQPNGHEWFEGDMMKIRADIEAILHEFGHVGQQSGSESAVNPRFKVPKGVCNFGHENVSYLHDSFFYHISKMRDEYGLARLTEAIYMNPDHPENHCIWTYENDKNSYYYVDNGEVRVREYKDMLHDIHKRVDQVTTPFQLTCHKESFNYDSAYHHSINEQLRWMVNHITDPKPAIRNKNYTTIHHGFIRMSNNIYPIMNCHEFANETIETILQREYNRKHVID